MAQIWDWIAEGAPVDTTDGVFHGTFDIRGLFVDKIFANGFEAPIEDAVPLYFFTDYCRYNFAVSIMLALGRRACSPARPEFSVHFSRIQQW